MNVFAGTRMRLHSRWISLEPSGIRKNNNNNLPLDQKTFLLFMVDKRSPETCLTICDELRSFRRTFYTNADLSHIYARYQPFGTMIVTLGKYFAELQHDVAISTILK